MYKRQEQKSEETYDMAVEILEAKIRECMEKIQRLGPINQKAIVEYEEIKKSYEELKRKVDRLSEERERVLKMIEDIETHRKETFLRTLYAVSREFRQVFAELMGGEGRLRLEEGDLDEAGLLIEASPKGTKILNIDSMSGGEKTMTALAFLFAVQRIRPAPFYILDEIDAALDKPNTKKITEFIIKHSNNSQFIVISHNEATIQSADCVYGVSKEDGESKIVGIRMP